MLTNYLGKLRGKKAGMTENVFVCVCVCVCVCLCTVFAGKCFYYAWTASLKICAWIHAIRVSPRVKEDEKGQVRNVERFFKA